MTSITASGEQLVTPEVGSEQQIISLVGGGWVVTWSTEKTDGTGYTIYQQIYHADGSVLGSGTQVNTHIGGSIQGVQFPKQVTALSNGGWVVTWPLFGQDGSGWGVYQQAYNANGTALGGETLVNTTVTGNQIAPLVTALASGGWVVTWSYGATSSDDDVYQQAYRANGTPLGSETRVNTSTAGLQQYQQITALTGGGWVVMWNSGGGAGGVGSGVYQQVYRADGSASGGESLVSATASGLLVTALTGGGWVVTLENSDEFGKSYNGFTSDGSSTGIYQQVYRADGSAIGAATLVNTSTARDQSAPQTTVLASGGWVVTWESNGNPDGTGTGLYQQAYTANGTALGSETLISLSYQTGGYVDGVGIPITRDGYASGEKTAALTGGGWVVIWENRSASFGDGISQQVYNANGAPVGGVTQVDTYTHDYSNPQITALADGGWVVAWTSAFNAGFNTGFSDGGYQRVFHLSSATVHADFNSDSTSDLLWQNDNGQAAVWTVSGAAQSGGSTVGGNPGTAWHARASGDFNGDGYADILWQNDNGQAAIWTFNGLTQTGGSTVGGNPGSDWKIKGAGDFNGDGYADILWQNDNGQAAIWTMNGLTQIGGSTVGGNPGASWHIKATADFNGDGKADILWQNDNGQAAIWLMDGLTQTAGSTVGGNPGASWHIKAAADFNGDGKADILWQNDNGQAAIWTMDGLTQIGGGNVGGNPGTSWHVIGTGDYNGDGKADILWQNDNGQAVVWTMNGFTQIGGGAVGGNPGTSWHLVSG